MSVLSDTGQMAALTGRAPATIRALCGHLRRPGGYDYETCVSVLEGEPDPVTTAEAQRYLGIPAGTIWSWVSRGLLDPVDRVGRVPRYRVSDLVVLRSRWERKAQLDL